MTRWLAPGLALIVALEHVYILVRGPVCAVQGDRVAPQRGWVRGARAQQG